MNIENTQKLLTAYSLLYRELREFGFECGDGWFNLIWQLSADIESAARIEGLTENTDAWPRIGVVKQKMGDLRVQFNAPVSDNIRVLVEVARKSSIEVCEICAAPCKKPPETVRVGWVESICDSCRTRHRSQLRPRDKTPKRPVWELERNNKTK